MDMYDKGRMQVLNFVKDRLDMFKRKPDSIINRAVIVALEEVITMNHPSIDKMRDEQIEEEKKRKPWH